MKRVFIFIICSLLVCASITLPVKAKEEEKTPIYSETYRDSDHIFELDETSDRMSLRITDINTKEEDLIEYDYNTDYLYLNGERILYTIICNTPAAIHTSKSAKSIVTGVPQTISFNINISASGKKIATIVGLIVAVQRFAAGLAAGGISLSTARDSFRKAIILAVNSANAIILPGDIIDAWIGNVSGSFTFTQQLDGNRCRNINRSYRVSILGKTRCGTWPDGSWFYTSQPA